MCFLLMNQPIIISEFDLKCFFSFHSFVFLLHMCFSLSHIKYSVSQENSWMRKKRGQSNAVLSTESVGASPETLHTGRDNKGGSKWWLSHVGTRVPHSDRKVLGAWQGFICEPFLRSLGCLKHAPQSYNNMTSCDSAFIHVPRYPIKIISWTVCSSFKKKTCKKFE